MYWLQRGPDINGTVEQKIGLGASLSSAGNVVATSRIATDALGSVTVFSWDGAQWHQLGQRVDGDTVGDFFGFGLQLSGNGMFFIVSASASSVTLNSYVKVYRYDSGSNTWIQYGNTQYGTTVGFGSSVSITDDGQTIAIGDNTFSISKGRAMIFDYDSGSSMWVQRGLDIIGEANGDQFGFSIRITAGGDTVVIGAPSNDGNGSNSGSVRVYDWDGSAWVQRGNDIDGVTANDRFGRNVDISDDGNTIACGTISNDTVGMDAGQLRIFEWDGSQWVQKGPSINGEAAGDQFSVGISLSADGNTVAGSSVFNTSETGQIRVFGWDGSDWVQIDSTIRGEVAGDRYGRNVSLSSNGKIIAGSSLLNDNGGTDTGQVRVFELLDINVVTIIGAFTRILHNRC